MDNGYKEAISEALLRKAVIDDHMNELNAIPSNDELAALYTFSDRHEARMRALFKKEEHRSSRVKLFTAMKRVAVFIAIAGTLVFSVLLTSPDVRAAVRATIVEWFETFTRYSYNSDTLEIVNPIWDFEYIPDGYDKTESYKLGAATYVVYTNRNNNEITFFCSVADDTSTGVDNEHSSFQIIFEQGIEYHVYEAVSDEYGSRVVWFIDGYAMNLSGLYLVEDLLRMAQSVKLQTDP